MALKSARTMFSPHIQSSNVWDVLQDFDYLKKCKQYTSVKQVTISDRSWNFLNSSKYIFS